MSLVRYFAVLTLPVLILILIIQTGCSPSRQIPAWKPMKEVGLKKFPFNKQREVGFYIESGQDSVLDQVFTNVVELDLMSLGYKPINLFPLVHGSVKSSRSENRTKPDTLALISKNAGIPWMIFIETQWGIDAKNIGTSTYYHGIITLYTRIANLKTRIIAINTENQDTLFAKDQVIEGNLYANSTGDGSFRTDPPWVICARHMSPLTNNLPAIDNVPEKPGCTEIPVRFVVDKQYKSKFTDWKNRLNLRLLIANDILSEQLNVRLKLKEISEWNFYSTDSFRLSFNRLIKDYSKSDGIYTIGFTYLINLEADWEKQGELGMGFIAGRHSVLRAKPSLQSVGSWNPIEEALVLVHELGHNLGGVHTYDYGSILYPSFGSMNYRFDELNKEVTQKTLAINTDLPVKEKIKQLAHIYSENRKKPSTDFYFFEGTLAANINLHATNGSLDSNMVNKPDSLQKFLEEVIPDDIVFRHMVAANMFTEQEKFDFALSELEKAEEIEENPEIFRVRSIILSEKGDIFKAADERKKFKRLISEKNK